MSVYDVTYKTLSHIHPGISTSEDIVGYIPPKKGVELERAYLLTLLIINLLISLETHKTFHPENN